MKKIMKGKKHCVSAGAWTFFLVIVFVSSGCATTNTAPYVSNDTTRKMTTASSESHQFKYVRLEEHNGEIRLYGKIEHRHAFCEQEAHVDLVSVDAEGKILLKKSLALRKPNYKLRGWQGAEFRVRLDRKKVATGTLVLTFHDDRCYGDLTFDCSANKSVAVTEKKRAADVQ